MKADDLAGIDSSARLLQYKQETEAELQAIISYWQNRVTDQQQGGFFGAVNNENIPDPAAQKGLVLNSRILWAFSAAFAHLQDGSCLNAATRAFDYLIDHFVDHEYGGVYWSVDRYGKMLDGKKQIYGLAFCIYGMTEYYKITRNEVALRVARELYDHIERYSLDRINGGYIEAFACDWKTIDDLRLSDKDDNERKTMNTHLHIIEAYSNLYRVWPGEILRAKIAGLLDIFDRHILNRKTHHLNLFMDDDWMVKSSLQSYGHDIEASWLLQECAEATGDANYQSKFREHAIHLADAASGGLDVDGGLWYEYEPHTGNLTREKHSWPQAEAMVGFLNAWQLTKDEKYLRYSLHGWEFVKQHICDRAGGEWFWGVCEDYSPMRKDKAGFWKCPYHNTRACLEIIRRIQF